MIGLDECMYYDQLKKMDAKQSETLSFNQETDNIYQASQRTLIISEADKVNEIHLEQENANSTVVWNPWVKKSNLMSDFPDLGYLNMLCVEAGNIRKPVKIEPQSIHSMMQCIKPKNRSE